jgi:hypothetical protein
MPKRQLRKNGRFVKDDYLSDLFDIAAASRLLIDHAQAGTPVAELLDVEAEARDSVQGLAEAEAELDEGVVFTW